MISLTVAIFFSVFDFIIMKYPPESINSVIGYKTLLSMKNQDTLDISQKHSGLIAIIFGSWSMIKSTAINREYVQLFKMNKRCLIL